MSQGGSELMIRREQRSMTGFGQKQSLFLFPLIAATVGLAWGVLHFGTARAQGNKSTAAPSQIQEPMGKKLIENLGCVVCHTLEGHTTSVQKEAPDLSYEGDKVRPDWLFAFLKKPHTLRPWLNARMPNFQLSDREVLALTEYIGEDLRDKTAPTLTGDLRAGEKATDQLAKAGKQLVSKQYFDCFSCHMSGGQKPEGPREGWAPDLALAASRLNADWIVRWLLDPQKIQPGTRMPAFFTDPGSGPSEILGGDEKRQILAIRAWLLGLDSTTKLDDHARAKARYTDVVPAEGRQLMVQLNCRGCHKIQGLPEGQKIAPVLSYAGSKFQQEWLAAFLRNPHTIRPAGYILGWRSRMPDFRLSGGEVKAIADYLMTLKYQGIAEGVAREKKTLSRLKKFQARKLFETTEGCIGCHRVKNRGGAMVGGLSGPDLSRAGERLQSNFIYKYIRSPRAFEPEGRMEIFGDFLSDENAKLLAEYVSTLK